MGGLMEIQVCDTVPRRLSAILSVLFFIPPAALFAAFFTGPMKGRNLPYDLVIMVTTLLVILSVGTSLVLNLTMNVSVRIDAGSGKVFRLRKLVGRTIRTTEHAVAQFDHISLYRAPRGGYTVMLVGQEREVRLRFTADLADQRKANRGGGQPGFQFR
jgi:hypothetical protein